MVDIHINRTIVPYLNENKMKLNEDKTETMIMTKRTGRGNKTIFNKLKINKVTIQPTETIKYLGFHLDRGLMFKRHINSLVSRGAMMIKTLYPLLHKNSQMSRANKALLYKQIIRPTILYGHPAFCSAADRNIQRLQFIQNRCLRLILNKDYGTRITDLHDEASMPTIKEYIIQSANKFYQKNLPPDLREEILSIRG